MVHASVAQQLLRITLITFAPLFILLKTSKPNCPLGFSSKDRLLDAGHHVCETKFDDIVRVQMVLLLPETGYKPQTPH